MVKFVLIAAGGAVGALLRYGASGVAYRIGGAGFPWGTLTVNLLGSFLIGLLWALAERYPFNPRVSPFLFVGVLGAFTTFSTYTLESFNLFREGDIRLGLINLVASNGLGLAAVILGFWTTRTLLGLIR